MGGQEGKEGWATGGRERMGIGQERKGDSVSRKGKENGCARGEGKGWAREESG